MRRLSELNPELVASLRPLVAKLAPDGPIRRLAYPRIIVRMLRRWDSEDFKLTERLEKTHGEPACNEAMALLLGEAGILDTDGVYTWAKG